MKAELVTILTQHEAPTPAEWKVIRWGNSSDRKWFMSHLHWAVKNQITVTIIPCGTKLDTTQLESN